MRVVFILLFFVLLAAIVTPVVVTVNFWMDAASIVARADQSGALVPGYGARPLWTVERMIAADQFKETWGGHAFPCRTLDLLWTDFTDPEAHPPAPSVSQRAAAALLGDRRIASARWQIRRLLVACELERRFNDGQLERIWLSRANFGDNGASLEKASRAYFSKPPAALDPLESAKLAALLHQPGLRTQPDRWNTEAQKILARATMRLR